MTDDRRMVFNQEGIFGVLGLAVYQLNTPMTRSSHCYQAVNDETTRSRSAPCILEVRSPQEGTNCAMGYPRGLCIRTKDYDDSYHQCARYSVISYHKRALPVGGGGACGLPFAAMALPGSPTRQPPCIPCYENLRYTVRGFLS